VLGIKIKTDDQMKRVQRSAEKAAAGNIYSTAGLLRKSAQDSMERSGEASPEGTPPNTRRGLLPRAIVFAVSDDKKSAVIGPRHSVAGEAGSAHEFGGNYKGTQFPERPFMGPALDRIESQFAGSFRGSIGE
jgi:phage gpG-like protein